MKQKSPPLQGKNRMPWVVRGQTVAAGYPLVDM